MAQGELIVSWSDGTGYFPLRLFACLASFACGKPRFPAEPQRPPISARTKICIKHSSGMTLPEIEQTAFSLLEIGKETRMRRGETRQKHPRSTVNPFTGISPGLRVRR